MSSSPNTDESSSTSTISGALGFGLVAAAGFALGYCFAKKNAVDSHPSAAWATTKLSPNGLRAGFDSGNPETGIMKMDAGNTKVCGVPLRILVAHTSPATDTCVTQATGIWSCEPGGFPVKNRASTETVYIFSGNLCKIYHTTRWLAAYTIRSAKYISVASNRHANCDTRAF